MRLRDVVNTESELLLLEVEALAMLILRCILTYSPGSLKRQGLAVAIMREYPRENPQSVYALEEALLWLERELYIGPDPLNPGKIFVTRRAEKAIEKLSNDRLAIPVPAGAHSY